VTEKGDKDGAKKGGRKGRQESGRSGAGGMIGTYTSMHSNSSRLRCLLRKAAARFLTRRASRLLSPDTSGGTKSLLETRSPTARFLVALGAGLAERLEPQVDMESESFPVALAERSCLTWVSMQREEEREGGVGGLATSGKSNT